MVLRGWITKKYLACIEAFGTAPAQTKTCSDEDISPKSLSVVKYFSESLSSNFSVWNLLCVNTFPCVSFEKVLAFHIPCSKFQVLRDALQTSRISGFVLKLFASHFRGERNKEVVLCRLGWWQETMFSMSWIVTHNNPFIWENYFSKILIDFPRTAAAKRGPLTSLTSCPFMLPAPSSVKIGTANVLGNQARNSNAICLRNFWYFVSRNT